MDLDRALASLGNILKLEERRGYNNRAVMGGIEAFLSRTLLPALDGNGSSQQAVLISRIAEELGGYSGLPPEQRAGKIRAALQVLQNGASGARKTPPTDIQPEVRLKQAPSGDVPGLDEPIVSLPGVGARRQGLFEKLGILTVRDALEFYPRDYHDRSTLRTISELQYGAKETFVAEIKKVTQRRLRGSVILLTAVLGDHTGAIEATWFSRNYVPREIEAGREMIFTGKIGQYHGKLKVEGAEYEDLERGLLHSGRIVPIYRSTESLSGKLLRRVLHDVVAYHAPRMEEYLPDWLLDRAGLMSYSDALSEIHFPTSWDGLEAARRRLGFGELLEMQLGALMKQKARKGQAGGVRICADHPDIDIFLSSLPFRLTGAQQRVINEVLGDIGSESPMLRMLQGDVGSGKTVVAAAALIAAAAAGYQGALMAPTEILAEQHYRSLSRLFATMEEHAPKVALLTGSLKGKARTAVYEGVASGETNIVVGTHAVIQQAVEFRDLALAVVDEQHRFGVEQRAALQAKARTTPHLLVMTATPIPRSLALTAYGDLDLSIIDEMPPGRQTIETRAYGPEERSQAYALLHEEVSSGRQAFVICPLVEESDKVEARAAVAEYERLQGDVFPDLRLGLLHGRMKPAEKEAVMEAFRDRELDVLVSTSVVEVGIDVPNATVMLVEGADRFGLAQLHQFRGRVGRGSARSYCLLLADSPGEEGRKRLEIVEQSTDGFYLAEQDLLMRGPGEFYGVRQSGALNLKVASLADLGLLEETRNLAAHMLSDDPQLESYPALADRVSQRMRSLAEAN
ncbi:MAG: ATP-dependent DNA helicase RecG [Chloroflexota bacterium]|nr:ATP-dependent DNA helicase RecG [Chloroflexota bacterium]